MKTRAARLTFKIFRFAMLGGALALLTFAVQHRAVPAQASVPGALEIADHALTIPAAVEDEGPYRLIDPVGPGGLTRDAAIGEVVASTMQGGNYGDHQYYSQYGPQIYAPPASGPHGGYNGGPHGGGWGGHR